MLNIPNRVIENYAQNKILTSTSTSYNHTNNSIYNSSLTVNDSYNNVKVSVEANKVPENSLLNI